LTRGHVEYRSNKGEISIASIKAEGMETGQVPITHLLLEMSDRVLRTVLHRHGERLEFQAEKLSPIYSYPVANVTGISVITLT